MADDLPDKRKQAQDVEAFLSKVEATPKRTQSEGKRGKLLFAMDATASRQPTWDKAASIQGQMFVETAALGGLDIQLAFYRGFGEFKVGRWTDNEKELLKLVTSVFCLAGETQIGKVLQHAVNEAKRDHLNALVFVGDMVEEDVDRLGKIAGELGLLGVPAFIFHEGNDPVAEYAFKQIAQLSGGACMNFDASSADVLRELLAAVAVYAAGGRAAVALRLVLERGAVLQLTHQMGGTKS